jgi:hypothetical protein
MRKLCFPARLQLIAYVGVWISGALATGCGTGALQNQSPAPSPQNATITQLRVGDAPADQVFSFEVTLGSSITLFSSDGAPSTISVSANRLELSHTAGKLQPLQIMSLKSGSYVAADINIQSPAVTYAKTLLTPAPVTLIDRVGGPDQTVHVIFNPPLVVGKEPMVLDLDVNLATALMSDSGGNIRGTNFTPASFSITAHPIGLESQQQDVDGEIEAETGKVVQVSSTGFVLQTGQSGAQLPFTVDDTTTFPHGTVLADLMNQIIKVDGITRSSGTLFAQEIEPLGDQNASQLEGTITELNSFNVPSLLSFAAQDGVGTGVTTAQIGQDFLMDISALADKSYAIDYGICDATPLDATNFPFDSAHLKAGQRVEMITESGVAAGQSITPTQVRLQQQAISGVVSNFTSMPGGVSTFDMTLPPDSYLTLLSGQSVIHVFQQPKTDVRIGAIANGDTVQVRGPLFWTGAQFNMVARRVLP